MKNDDFKSRVSEITKAAEQKQNSPDAARTLFEGLTREARRQAEIECGQARRRSPLVKVLLALALISAFFAATAFIYGMLNFQDAPLRQNGEAYTGKIGQPRTKEDFERFVIWERSMFAAFVSTFLFAFSFAALDAREKRRRKAKTG